MRPPCAFQSLRERVDLALELHVQVPEHCADILRGAVHYAMFPGGKRLRPILTLLAGELAGGSSEQAMPAACAIKLLHTSSLIFDDPPCSAS